MSASPDCAADHAIARAPSNQRLWREHLADRYLLGSHAARSPVDVPSERKWFLLYAPVSLVYRLIVSYAIVLFVMDMWLGLGLVMLVLTFYMLLWAPAWKGLKHLFGSQVQAHRWRAWGRRRPLCASASLPSPQRRQRVQDRQSARRCC